MDAALQVEDTKIMVSSTSSGDDCISSACLRFGSVTVDETPVHTLGKYETDDFTVTLSNSKSFSRVAFSSDKAVLKVGQSAIVGGPSRDLE